MRRYGLNRLHRDEPPALTTCLAVSAICSVAIFVFLLLFFPISKYAPGTQTLMFKVFGICFTATLIWRIHRYGFFMTRSEIRKAAGPNPNRRPLRRRTVAQAKHASVSPIMDAAKRPAKQPLKRTRAAERERPKGKTFFRFNLAHMLLIFLAVGLTGTVLSQGIYVGILRSLTGDSAQAHAFGSGWRASAGLFAENPIVLMASLAASVVVGLLLSSHIARTGEERGWSTRAVNRLVALMAVLLLPALLLSGVSLAENLVIGIGMLTFTAWGSVFGWRVACWALGGKPPERRRRFIRRVGKPKAKVGTVPRSKPKARSYEPKNVYVRVPHLGQYSPHHRRSILLP